MYTDAHMKWVIGVDEAGRGPLAGPVAVGVAMVPADFDWGLLLGVTDSKKLSEKKRENIFSAAQQLQKEGKLSMHVALVGARVIDRDGINTAVNRGIARALKQLEQNSTIYCSKESTLSREETYVKLDGGLRASKSFVHQETIIKGDQKERVIGLASIAAKVTRDRYMVRRSHEPVFAPYGFAAHKGYGTKAHTEAIEKHGLSLLHRTTYCQFYIGD